VKIQSFQVNAFTGNNFLGNPAVVCCLKTWIDDQSLQSIAFQNQVSETAFLVESNSEYHLRWFTPKVEIDLCGHATLASGFVVFSYLAPHLTEVCFNTVSGKLCVEKYGDLLMLDLPTRRPRKSIANPLLIQGLGGVPEEVLISRDILAVFKDETQVRTIVPDFKCLSQLEETFGVIVTAPGESVDFVSRFFAPNAGIFEDSVTGSAHCTLIPYWADRLDISRLHAYQLSSRGGELFCLNRGDRVSISGRALLDRKWEIIDT